jgi:hypothetical protein
MSTVVDPEHTLTDSARPLDVRSFLGHLAALERNGDDGSEAMLLLLLPRRREGVRQMDLAGRLTCRLPARSGVRYELGCLEGGRLGLLVQGVEEAEAAESILRQAREAAAVPSAPWTGLGVGVALYPRDGRTGEALLEAASRSLWLFERLTRDVWPWSPPPRAAGGTAGGPEAREPGSPPSAFSDPSTPTDGES